MKKPARDAIGAPEIQYMNIYKQSAKRLSVFEKIASHFIEDRDRLFFFGDATAYEQYLESMIKEFEQEGSQNLEFKPAESLSLEAPIFKLTEGLTFAALTNQSS